MAQSTLADAVKTIRGDSGLTKESLAEASGLSRFTIMRIENGETLNPGADTLSALATALGVSVDELLPAEPKRDRKAAQRGFSLVELLITIGIIGLAAGIVGACQSTGDRPEPGHVEAEETSRTIQAIHVDSHAVTCFATYEGGLSCLPDSALKPELPATAGGSR